MTEEHVVGNEEGVHGFDALIGCPILNHAAGVIDFVFHKQQQGQV